MFAGLQVHSKVSNASKMQNPAGSPPSASWRWSWQAASSVLLPQVIGGSQRQRYSELHYLMPSLPVVCMCTALCCGQGGPEHTHTSKVWFLPTAPHTSHIAVDI